jgi:hypothetical protein
MAVILRCSFIVMMKPITCVGVLNIGRCTLLSVIRRVMARRLNYGVACPYIAIQAIPSYVPMTSVSCRMLC